MRWSELDLSPMALSFAYITEKRYAILLFRGPIVLKMYLLKGGFFQEQKKKKKNLLWYCVSKFGTVRSTTEIVSSCLLRLCQVGFMQDSGNFKAISRRAFVISCIIHKADHNYSTDYSVVLCFCPGCRGCRF